VLPEMKGNGLSSASENDLVRFLWPEWITRQGGARGQHGEASGELNRRKENLAGVRVSACEREKGMRWS
jgi:hypothetical protein